MNNDTKLLLISAIHTHFRELALSPDCVGMCEFVLGLRHRKPYCCQLTADYNPTDFLLNNFQDALRRKLPHVYSTIFPQS